LPVEADSEILFMIYKLGRFLQFVGLFVFLPMAMAGNLLNQFGEGKMLFLCGAGVAVFYVGYLLQQSSKPR
jgi:hypothetical protein